MDYYTSLLANAIIKQAADDYVAAYKNMLRAGPLSNCSKTDIYRMGECLDFFRGRWYKRLTSLDPEYLIRLLNEKAKEEFAEEMKEKPKKKAKTYLVFETCP